MAQTIKLKRSATQGAIPSTSDLALGEVAINTYDGQMYIKKSVGGVESIVPVGGSGSVSYLEAGMTEYEYTATSSQTTFSGSDNNSVTLSYTANSIMVFLNGVLQDDGVDYTATNGTSVVFTSALTANDEVRIVAIDTVASTSTLQNPTKLDAITTVNAQAAYSLTLNSSAYTPSSETALIVSLNGITQEPGDSFTISGSTITFSPALVTGDVVDYIVDMGRAVTIGQYDSDLIVSGELEVTGDIIGDLRGATLFKGQAGEALSKGDVVYISGISGNTTVVSKADADDAAKMPAFGVVAADASINTSVDIYTFGRLSNLNTSTFSEGDELYVSTTAGVLTNSPPTGETALLQKIAKVTRSDNSAGSIFIMGAGRSNAVPNLDDGDIFIGNASNQAVSAALNTSIVPENTNLYYTDARVDSHLSGGTGVTYNAGEISIGQDVSTTATPTFGNITTTGYLRGPSTFTIDPATHGDNTGTLVVAGNLQVDGTTTTINSTTMTVDDLNITLASGAANAAAANGAGITVDTAGASITYDATNDEWDFNKSINITGQLNPQTIYVKSNTYTTTSDIALTSNGVIKSGNGLWIMSGSNDDIHFGSASNNAPSTGWQSVTEIAAMEDDGDLRLFNIGSLTAPAADNLLLNGYGLMGNRSSPVYVTNAGTGGVQINADGGHGTANRVALFDQGGITFDDPLSATGEVYTDSNQDAWAFRATTGTTSNSSGLWFTGTTARLLLRDSSGNIKTMLAANGTNAENVINNNTIWHAGNDGSGSGLDADTVDGIQGSNLLTLNGSQTITGTKTFSSAGGNVFLLNDTNATNATNANIYFYFQAQGSNLGYLGYGTSSNNYLYLTNPNAPIYLSGSSVLLRGGYEAWGTDNDGSGSGLDADTLDGVQGANYLRSDVDDTTSGYIVAEGFVGSSGALRVTNPGGASFATTTTTSTGYLKITLPVSWTNSMMSMTIKCYEYTTNESFNLHCGGYNYSPSTTWVNTFAYIIGGTTTNRNFNVRFGHDGTKCAIYIGESNSTWSYVQFAVTDVMVGYGGYSAANWHNGWSCSITTSLGTITQTESSTQLNKYIDNNISWHAGNDGSGSGLDADTVDGIQAANFLRSDTADTAAGVITFSTGIVSGQTGARYPIKVYSNQWPEVQFFRGSAEELRIGAAEASGSYNSAAGDFYVFDVGTGKMNLLVPSNGGSFKRNNGAYTVWDSGNDGSGSGLDADTLDGVQGSGFLRTDGSNTGTFIDLYRDVNSGLGAYIDFREGSAQDIRLGVNVFDNELPQAGTALVLDRINSGGGDAHLVVHGEIFAAHGGTVTAGKKVWHTGNDGSGSGLDADTVDGIQGASLLRSDTDDNMAGKIIFTQGSSNRDRGIIGQYSPTSIAAIWSMGTSYQIAANGSTAGTLYGLCYSYNPNYGSTGTNPGAISGLNHQMQWRANGATQTAIGTGVYTIGNVTAYSDRRVKTNIEVISNALEKVQKLSGYTFDRTDIQVDPESDTPETFRQTGLIAQEVLEVLPEAVTGTEDLGYGVAYGNMVGLLIEAIKELKAEIEELKNGSSK